MFDLGILVLAAVALAFAVSIGAHYTGACMGMPRAAGAIRTGPALGILAALAFVGAAVASEGVETTVGHGIVGSAGVSLGLATVIVGGAFVLTSAYNFLTLPTSTIQILVFATVGAALGTGLAVRWTTIETLLLLWAVAPVAAFALGYLYVRVSDRIRPAPTPTPGAGISRTAATALVLVGAASSFAMGANDVANASGALVMTGVLGLVAAALLGGAGLAVGALTWGRPLLRRVAFDLVRLDPRMATMAQLAQATVILVSVTFGLFTSINQALIGGMIGTGVARGRATVLWTTIRGVFVGWAIGPISGLAVGYAGAVALHAVGTVF